MIHIIKSKYSYRYNTLGICDLDIRKVINLLRKENLGLSSGQHNVYYIKHCDSGFLKEEIFIDTNIVKIKDFLTNLNRFSTIIEVKLLGLIENEKS